MEISGRKIFDSERLIAFSDAVIAVAITLLVLDLKLPEGVSDAQLPDALAGSLHGFFVYALSFLVIGLLWMGHHEQFSYICRVDAPLIWLNLLYLMTIGLIPFFTSLLSDHGAPLPTCLYAGTLVLTSLLSAAIWWHASRDPELMVPGVAEPIRRAGLLAPLSTGAVFAISIPIALIWGATPAQWSWLLLIPAGFAQGLLDKAAAHN